jgi:hypothetical protein
VAMRLISSRSWRWSFSWRFQRSSASAFRSCVACHHCLQNFSRPSTKYMFFCWRCSRPSSVRVSNKQNIQNLKRKLGFSKTLDWFFVLRMIKIKICKRKIKRKTENIHKHKLDWILITCSLATALEKGACWRLIIVSKFLWTYKQTSPPS